MILLVSIVRAQTQPWKISGFNILAQKQDGVAITIDQFSAAGYNLQHIKYRCPKNIQIYPIHRCDNAQLSLKLNNQPYEVMLNTLFDANSRFWELELSSLNQEISLKANAASNAVKVMLQSIELNDFFSGNEGVLKDINGLITANLLANISDLTVQTEDPLSFNQFSYEYSEDVVFFELGGQASFQFDGLQQQLTVEIEISKGEMLFESLYADFSQFPLAIQLTVELNGDFDYDIKAQITNQQSMILDIHIIVDQQFNWLIPETKLDVKDTHHFNQQILNSILGIYGFGNTEMSGGFKARLLTDDGKLTFFQIDFNDYYVLNQKRKIQVDALQGQVFWSFKQPSQDSILNWQALLLAGMPIKAAQADFNLSKDVFKLLGEHVFPVFDGAIKITEFSADKLFADSIGMSLEAKIEPISLKLITEKLAWPEMAGTISGAIPGMVKKDSVIEFLGALQLQVFDGQMRVENLSLERLFGVAPVIAADVTFEGFDLALLTETFGFGQITGKLSGIINDLRITNWKTDRLDAHVFTVKTKGVKQTISQRAIDNISSLGGIKGAISKTFLRFFDDFRYNRIELSCKLHNSVCEIGGLKNQDNQFVIVEGGGIPKINIVGFVRTINWSEFISRLLNANYDN
ncbi:MAG: hypothetical protein R3E90_15590 [Marinicella sp.]